MVTLILCTVLIIIAGLAALLKPVYSQTPDKELVRRSKKGDQGIRAIYEVSRYGKAPDVISTLVSVIFSAVAFALIAVQLDFALAVLLIGLFAFSIFYLLPYKSRKLSTNLAKKVSPYMVKVLEVIPGIKQKNTKSLFKEKLYEKDDLLDLINQQKAASHNRIEQSELEMANHALTFGDKVVLDYMIPKDESVIVGSDDPIGPILLSELHESGLTRFPVKGEKDDCIVGTLYLNNLIDKRTTGIVSNVMSTDVFYVNEKSKLQDVLDAFIKTKHQLFIVINSSEEMVGVISIEDVVKQLTGLNFDGGFKYYDNSRRVASLK